MASLPPAVGDVVQHREPGRDLPVSFGLVVGLEASGWVCVEWSEPGASGEQLWFPPEKIQVISKAYEKQGRCDRQ